MVVLIFQDPPISFLQQIIGDQILNWLSILIHTKLAVNSNSYKIIGQNPSPHKLAVNNSYKVIGQNPSPVIYQSQNKQGAPPFKSQQGMRAKHNGGSNFRDPPI